jgi:hypothetical protein
MIHEGDRTAGNQFGLSLPSDRRGLPSPQAGKIKDKPRIELETLLGCRVTQQLAAHWKKHLEEIRRDLAEELKSDPEG